MIDALCLLVTVAESSHREFYSAAHGGRNHLILVSDIDQNQHQPPQLLGWGAGDRANEASVTSNGFVSSSLR
jgi:hypothetical protein